MSDELDELAVAIGYGERPEGQGHVLRPSGAMLAELIQQERRESRARLEELELDVRTLQRVWRINRDWGLSDAIHDAEGEAMRCIDAALQESPPFDCPVCKRSDCETWGSSW